MKLRRLTERATATAHAAEDAVILATETKTKALVAAQDLRQAKVRLKAARKGAKAAKQAARATAAAAALAEKAARRTRKKAAKVLAKFKARHPVAKNPSAPHATAKLHAPKPAPTSRGTVHATPSQPAAKSPKPTSVSPANA